MGVSEPQFEVSNIFPLFLRLGYSNDRQKKYCIADDTRIPTKQSGYSLKYNKNINLLVYILYIF